MGGEGGGGVGGFVSWQVWGCLVTQWAAPFQPMQSKQAAVFYPFTPPHHRLQGSLKPVIIGCQTTPSPPTGKSTPLKESVFYLSKEKTSFSFVAVIFFIFFLFLRLTLLFAEHRVAAARILSAPLCTAVTNPFRAVMLRPCNGIWSSRRLWLRPSVWPR